MIWNYLRVRGEYWKSWPYSRGITELPPRARRIHVGEYAAQRLLGTTSACAENTFQGLTQVSHGRNYLRVRGEYRMNLSCARGFQELPPRARRIRLSAPIAPTRHELPPRARRILTTVTRSVWPMGTTSACAENTQAG